MFRTDAYTPKNGDKLNTSNLFASLTLGYKEGNSHVIAAFDDAQVHTTLIDSEKNRAAVYTSILNTIDPFVPKASNVFQCNIF